VEQVGGSSPQGHWGQASTSKALCASYTSAGRMDYLGLRQRSPFSRTYVARTRHRVDSSARKSGKSFREGLNIGQGSFKGVTADLPLMQARGFSKTSVAWTENEPVPQCLRRVFW
jgi:hypothetical protein